MSLIEEVIELGLRGVVRESERVVHLGGALSAALQRD